ncbi:MFS transporter [Brevibacterium sp. 50QC2O2]|uniref:MFS transporter n=1 Tax=Brevibacterium TaxID=1696 RepID=UPI00211B7749|nr:MULTISPECIES: MFS transporter [unclassified Brevibacterium]MCQ9384683.1 MFS transporter [Brevibacterium sp. 68QC2CO]MCQ9389269.1 MFS transporter [Brevibacterium sp. 50QC2O2]
MESAGSADADEVTAPQGYRTFLHVLVNTAAANVTTSFVWFALTFWAYAQTRNVIVAGVIAAAYMLFVSVFSMFFGTLVDRFRKKAVMTWATLAALIVFALDSAAFFAIGEQRIIDLGLPWFWLFAIVLLAGAVVEQLRSIALSTTVTLLVPAERRPNANGLVGTVQGVGMIVTSVFSGLSVGFLGMGPTLLIGVGALTLTLLHLLSLRIPERRIATAGEVTGWVDLRGGWLAVVAVPGLVALVLFTTVNNLFSGAAMAVMDPYGIEMFGVQGWGIWFAVMSTGFIVGGSVVALKGLGRNPIRTMLLLAAAIGLIGALSTIREQGWVFILGIWVFMALIPAIEAAEQTVIQRVVPYEKQGRVFGFANTFEAAAAPITALLVAPLAELWIIPALRTEAGAALWAPVLGSGHNRGIALILLATGIGCIILAGIAALTPQYRLLSRRYAQTGTPT